jgi:hypothetical protein
LTTTRTLDPRRARAAAQSTTQSTPLLLFNGANATLSIILQQLLYSSFLLSLLLPPHPLLVLLLSLQCRQRSSPSAEFSELSRRNSWLGPAILCLLGKGQHAIAVVAAAVRANANVCLMHCRCWPLDNHGGALEQYRWHRPMQHNQGDTKYPLLLPSGDYLLPCPGGHQGDSKQNNNCKCTYFAGRFDGHCNAAVQYSAHHPMEEVQGFTRSHWMPPSGKHLL